MNDKLKNIKIPEGWENLELGTLAKFTTGKKDVNEGNDEGIYPFYTCSKSISHSDNYSFDKEALLIAGNGDVGTVHYFNGKFEAYQRTYVLYDFKVDVKYLYQYLKSKLINHLLKEQSGTTIQFIKIGQLTGFTILLPTSLTEQKKIAQILSTVDKAIEQTEQLIAKYERIKTGLMQDLLTKGIDENGNIRSEETHKFKDSPLGRIPVEWECGRLDTFLSLKQYGVSIPLVERGYTPVLRMNNIKFGELFLNEIKYSVFPLQSQFILNNNDILFNRTNSIEHVGRTGIFREQNIKYSFASYLVRLVPNKKVNPEYLNLILNYKTSQDRIKSIATSAVHQANVNPTNLGNLYFAFPKINEQYKILEILNKGNYQIIKDRAQLQKLKRIKTALMQDLLSGKKRVNLIMNGEL